MTQEFGDQMHVHIERAAARLRDAATFRAQILREVSSSVKERLAWGANMADDLAWDEIERARIERSHYPT